MENNNGPRTEPGGALQVKVRLQERSPEMSMPTVVVAHLPQQVTHEHALRYLA